MTRALPIASAPAHVEGRVPGPALPRPDGYTARRRTVTVDVGGVPVGIRPSDRRPVDDKHRHRRRQRHRDPGRATGACGLGTGARHRQHRGRGSRGPGDRRAPPGSRRGRAGHRRLPLQRPPPAGALSGSRARPREIPHQPGQCRLEAPRRKLPDDRPGRHRERPAGPDRRQLGLARSAAADVS